MKSVLLFYNWFLPAYKAGGPIQSIGNLVKSLDENYKFYIICSNTDHGETEPLKNIISDKWLPFEAHRCEVIYLSKPNINFRRLKDLINKVNPDVIITNGIYSLPFSIFPAIISKSHTVLTVRGMLHPGALSQKKLKKSVFLFFFKLLKLHKKITFHATDDVEAGYIQEQLGSSVKIKVAGNFPHINSYIDPPPKEQGLILGSVGLISPMKNHHLVLLALKQCSANITYHIYGPVKDSIYWNECKELISELPANITVEYHGEVPPHQIKDKIKEFHFFILPSKSENFGHAIFEALSAGRPVITSNYTPWNSLEKNRAGFNVDINNIKTISESVDRAVNQSNQEYLQWTHSTREYALRAINIEDIKEQYRQLFNA
ncbi:MAG: glycosyltransferase family 4 protein [Segetibacter sp.]|nr:glycosyltransferase family 4 protein [Segetibacter sp.]